MDASLITEMQEALLAVFSSYIFLWLMILAVVAVLSGIGVVLLEMSRQMTR